VLGLRAIKSAYEIELVRAAAAMADAVCERVPFLLREGLTEAEFAGKVEAEARALGHEGIIRMRGFNQEMFYGQLLTGVSGTVPSYLDAPLAGAGLSAAVAQGVSRKPIGRNEPVVLDFVAVSKGYIADFTRVFSLGPLPDELQRAYEVALQIQREVISLVRPGVTCLTLYDTALDVAEDAGLERGFMGRGAGQARFIGHGVGLELDELPVLAATDLPLAEGMVFALEPKFVLPGLGAIGVENTHAVTADGVDTLTRATEELRVVE
jgi:Xaa-Pro dipeptidase